MIHHVSLPAKNPKSTAEALARILGGEAMPFPVVAGAWMAWSSDGVTELEILPITLGGTPNPVAGREPLMVPIEDGNRLNAWHLAISTEVRAAEIVRIAREAGWRAEICDRAGYFTLVEIWIDGCTMIEVLDQEMLARYKATFDAVKWKAMLAAVPQVEQGSDTIELLRSRSNSAPPV